MHVEIIHKECERLSFVLLKEDSYEVHELIGSNGTIVAKELFNTLFFADCCDGCLGFEFESILWHTNVSMLRIPSMRRESIEGEYCLIQVNKLETFSLCLIQAFYHPREAITIVALSNLNWRLCAPNIFEGNFELPVYFQK